MPMMPPPPPPPQMGQALTAGNTEAIQKPSAQMLRKKPVKKKSVVAESGRGASGAQAHGKPSASMLRGKGW